MQLSKDMDAGDDAREVSRKKRPSVAATLRRQVGVVVLRPSCFFCYCCSADIKTTREPLVPGTGDKPITGKERRAGGSTRIMHDLRHALPALLPCLHTVGDR